MYDLALAGHPINILPREVLFSTDAQPGYITSRLAGAVDRILCGHQGVDEAFRLTEETLAELDRLSIDTHDEEFADEHLIFAAFRTALNPYAFSNNIKLLAQHPTAGTVRTALADCLESAEEWFHRNYQLNHGLEVAVRETITTLRTF